MRIAPRNSRRRRRLSHAVLGLGLFALLGSVMVADTHHTKAAGLSRALSAVDAGSQKIDAVAIAVAPGFQRAATTAATLNPSRPELATSGGDTPIGPILTLAAALSLLTVVNIGLLRHLRRAYASSRRRARRRG